MIQSSLLKYHQELLKSLQKVQKYGDNPQNNDDLLDFLIIWLKIRQICLQVQQKYGRNEPNQKNHYVNKEILSTYIKLLAQFKQKIQPLLIDYTLKLKKQPLSERILIFTGRMRDYFEISQRYLKDLPSEAMHIYEESWFFLQLYRFALDQKLIHNIMHLVYQKMNSLKKAFEIEAGNANLLEDQKKISEKLHSSLRIKPSDNDISITNASSSKEQVSFQSIDTPILSSDIALPEENEDEIVNIEEPEINEITSEKTTHQIATPESISYPLIKWAFPQSIDTYWSFRFCNNCGNLVDRSTMVCNSCGQRR
ncbi:hypothetical protein [Candidatus Harpocratesius sp.]